MDLIHNIIFYIDVYNDLDILNITTFDINVKFKNEADISDKYIDPPHTTDFAIMFLPTEGLYAEIVRQPGMLDDLQHQRIVVAGTIDLATIRSHYTQDGVNKTLKNPEFRVYADTIERLSRKSVSETPAQQELAV